MSLDAYRGFIMLALVSVAFGLKGQAMPFPDSEFWNDVLYHASHVKWVGCSAWDLVMPAFVFMVGVAMPYSYASRIAKGAAHRTIFKHACKRAVVLVLLGILLVSNGRSETNFTFVNVLIQIGLAYPLAFLLLNKTPQKQILISGLILLGYWLAFALYPLPPEGFDYREVGLKSDWKYMTGFFAHWEKNVNIASDFDVWFLNLFPRSEPFRYDADGYPTLQFVCVIVTMTLGILTGQFLRTGRWSPYRKLGGLFLAGAACVGSGVVFGSTVCPIVKKLWTPSFCLYSGGLVIWMLAFFYWVIDVLGMQRWAFPCIVAGMNPIFLYCTFKLGLAGWAVRTLNTHLGPDYLNFLGAYKSMGNNLAFTFVLWLICYWMYRQRIFVRI